MRLLIVTQKVDRTDPILGFFHRWVEEFARQCERVTVVGQLVGEHQFGVNVRVVSLRKEEGISRARQVLRFWGLQWGLRREYDAVLVHMTPIWVVLGTPLWVVLRKPRFLWYEARGARWPLKVAIRSVRRVFSASVHGMPVPTRKSLIVGHGIDTDFFAPGAGQREDTLLITVGRITQSKHLPVILDAFEQLPERYELMIVGRPITEEDKALHAELRNRISAKGLRRRVSIQPAPQDVVQPLLQRAMLFLHASSTSLDKAVLEAMACGCIVVSTAEAVRPLLPPPCQATPETLAERICGIAAMSPSERAALAGRQRALVERDHGLCRLVTRLIAEMRGDLAPSC